MHSKRWLRSIPFLLTLFCQGCSYQNWYTGIREQQRQECYRHTGQSEVQQCLESVRGMDYDQYKRAREERIAPGS